MTQESIIFGRNPVLEVLKNQPDKVEKIYLRFGVQGKPIEEIQRIARKQSIPITFLDKEKFKRLAKSTKTEDTQGVVALLTIVQYKEIDTIVKDAFEQTDKPILVILDKIQDPQNLGAIARTAECAGVQGLIVPSKDSTPITSTVVKASAGAILNLPIAKVSNLAKVIDYLKAKGFWILGTSSLAKDTIWKANFDIPLAVVIGNEGKGISRSLLKMCDLIVKIPMFGKTDSLNASVATGIILFEILRQRGLSVQE